MLAKCIQWFVHLLKFSRILELVEGVESFEIWSRHDAHISMFYLYIGSRVLDLYEKKIYIYIYIYINPTSPKFRLFLSYLFDDAVANKPYLMKIWFCLLCHNYTDKPTGKRWPCKMKRCTNIYIGYLEFNQRTIWDRFILPVGIIWIIVLSLRSNTTKTSFQQAYATILRITIL